jgi:hypothetical protein
MSRKNKVNPAHYKVAGRLSPDDLARERMKQNARQDAPAWQERPGHAAAVKASVGPSDQDHFSALTWCPYLPASRTLRNVGSVSSFMVDEVQRQQCHIFLAQSL